MARFHVHPVEARPGSQACGRDEGVLEAVEVVVGDERVVGGQSVLGVEDGAVVRDDGPGRAIGLAVAPGVRELQDQHALMPVCASRGFARVADEAREGGQGAFV